ncbi:hypothetical protein [Corynebacterium sp.]|uniref:hypothetical protein n=1 Tax=Corynebacterium sp. TaxID=1720 RepID=UPI0026DCD34A|nr:hypothetical protein [Corynebacterium sp.]MDO5031249.1 hypothetical protein [Corynebacterium sp.]
MEHIELIDGKWVTTDDWNITLFGRYMNSLLKRYQPSENGLSPEDFELRAAWRTHKHVFAVFSVKTSTGLAFVGMEIDPLPGAVVPSEGLNVSSEEQTAVSAWTDQLAGDAIAHRIDYTAGDKIQWRWKSTEGVPRYFSDLKTMNTEVYLPSTPHDEA